MTVIKTKIDGLVIIEPKIFADDRGYFYESYSQKEFDEKVAPTVFVQDNQSKSSYGVIRGLHFQNPPFAQAKLVRCVKGVILDVAVDLRKNSPTYMMWESAILSEDNHRQFFLPRGFAHGFSVLSDEAIFQYKCDNPYNKESECAINALDKMWNINWGIPMSDIKLSDKDSKNMSMLEFMDKNQF